MSTPLYDALTQFAAQNPLRMAMPGHKGKPIPGLPAEYARLDFTELPPTGNLYGEDMDCIAQAEQAWAETWGLIAACSSLAVPLRVFTPCSCSAAATPS